MVSSLSSLLPSLSGSLCSLAFVLLSLQWVTVVGKPSFGTIPEKRALSEGAFPGVLAHGFRKADFGQRFPLALYGAGGVAGWWGWRPGCMKWWCLFMGMMS